MAKHEQQKWFIGDTDSHTNEVIQREFTKMPSGYGTEYQRRVTDRGGPQQVFEVPLEFIKWLRDNKADQHLKFRILREPAPDCDLVPFVLERVRRGTVQAARAKVLKRIKQKRIS